MRFKERLEKIMIDKNLTRKEVCSLIGCSPSSMSMWLNGDVEPLKDRQKEILKMLGGEWTVEPEKPERGSMRRVSPADVAKIMGISLPTLYKGLQQGVFSWGYAIKTTAESWTYIINADKFERVEGITV